jgi:hypothetical protein
LPAPYSKQAAEKIRPELQGQPGADHPGFGTLLYSIPKVNESNIVIKSVPAAPGGVIAKGRSKEIKLSWIASVGAKSYTIKRALKIWGPYSTIKKGVIEQRYTDNHIKPGRVYFYSITSLNDHGESENSYPAKICAGLPISWKNGAVGNLGNTGVASYDGRLFTIEAGGNGIGGLLDGFQYVYFPLEGNGTIVARFVPQVPSQFAEMGLMIRDSLTVNAANASLLITSVATKDIEIPVWSINFSDRPLAGESTILSSGRGLNEPYVRWGRLMEPYWLKLTRIENRFIAFISPDGKVWSIVGTKEVSMKSKVYIGLAAASCIEKMSTTVHFDHVAVSN